MNTTQKKLNISDYINDVNKNFSGANGYGGEMPDNLYFEGQQLPKVPAQMQQLPDADPFEITVANSTGGALTARLFGANKYSQAVNNGSDVGLVITTGFANVSYLQLLMQSAAEPFETSSLTISSINITQVTKVFNVVYSPSNGESNSKPVIPQNYFSPMQQSQTMVIVPRSIVIDGNTYIEAVILAGATVTYTFFPKQMVKTTRALSSINQAPLKTFAGRPTLIGMLPTPQY